MSALRPAVFRLADRLRAAALSWHESVAGVAAVEFALVLPVMVTLLLGMSEVTLAVNVDRKITLTSRALADLSSRVQTLTTAQMNDIFSAAAVVMQPHASSNMRMVLTQMRVTKVGANFEGRVDWSCPRGPGAVAKPDNVVYPVPTGFQTDNTYYMVIETALPYAPMFGRTFTGTITLGETTPWPIRNNSRVALNGGCPT